MKINTKVLIFGIISGFIWSLALSGGHWFSPSSEAVKMLLSGILAGITVSFALKFPLIKYRQTIVVLILGVISLPLGAFLYGFFETIIEMLIGRLTGGIYDLHPILTGLYCAAISVASLGALYLFPLAILTTFILKTIIFAGKNEAKQ